MAKSRDEQSIKDNDGWGLIHKAASSGNVKAVYACMIVGGDINRAIESSDVCNGLTPLILATQSGQIETMLFLARFGADLEMKANGMSPLMYAIQHQTKALECMEVLVGMGADVTILKNFVEKSKHGIEVLSQLNVHADFIEVGKILAKSESVQSKYKSNNDTSPIIIKLDIKADIKVDIGKLFAACDIDSVIKFVQNDSVPEKEKYAANLFAGAAMQCSPEYTQMMVALIKAGYDISREDSNGTSAYELIKNEVNGVALCLLGANSDISSQINALSDDGMNDIHRAIKAGREQTLAILLSCGGDANIAMADGTLPTIMVAQSKVNMHEMFYVLVRNGANINVYDIEQVQKITSGGFIEPYIDEYLVADREGTLHNPEMEAAIKMVDKDFWQKIVLLDLNEISQLISAFQRGELIDIDEIILGKQEAPSAQEASDVDVKVVGKIDDVVDDYFE